MTRITWPLVALATVVGAVFVALYALAPPSAKPDIAPLFGSAVAAIAAGSALVSMRSHGEKLDKIEDQTNGKLRVNIREALHDELPGLVRDSLSALLADHLPEYNRRSR